MRLHDDQRERTDQLSYLRVPVSRQFGATPSRLGNEAKFLPPLTFKRIIRSPRLLTHPHGTLYKTEIASGSRSSHVHFFILDAINPSLVVREVVPVALLVTVTESVVMECE